MVHHAKSCGFEFFWNRRCSKYQSCWKLHWTEYWLLDSDIVLSLQEIVEKDRLAGTRLSKHVKFSTHCRFRSRCIFRYGVVRWLQDRYHIRFSS